MRRLLPDRLARVRFRRPCEGVVRCERACAGHLQVAGRRADGGEGRGGEEGASRGRAEYEEEEGGEEGGWEEVEVPGGEVRLGVGW